MMFGCDGITRFPPNLFPNNRSSGTEPQDSGSIHSSLILDTIVFLEVNLPLLTLLAVCWPLIFALYNVE